MTIKKQEHSQDCNAILTMQLCKVISTGKQCVTHYFRQFDYVTIGTKFYHSVMQIKYEPILFCIVQTFCNLLLNVFLCVFEFFDTFTQSLH